MLYKKRGQFYLLAAIIIVAVLFSVAGITNYIMTKDEDVRKQEIADELNLEGESVINSGIFDNEGDLNALLTLFVTNYGAYIGTDYEFLFIYADESVRETGKVSVLSSENIPSDVSLIIGGGTITYEILGPYIEVSQISIQENEDSFILNFGGVSYPIELTEGQNFFFIIQQPTQE